MPLARDQFFQLRMTPEEREMLHRLAEAEGLTASDILRQFIRREHGVRFPNKSSSKPKRKRRVS